MSATDVTNYQRAIKLALMVAESGGGQAGKNVARVLAGEVRRLQEQLSTYQLQVHAGELSEAVESVGNRLQARISHLEAELARSKRAHDEDRVTINEIEAVCIVLGYDAESGDTLTDWIPRRLGALAGTCRVCGCTDDWGCDAGCSWVNAEHTLCSECENVRAARRET